MRRLLILLGWWWSRCPGCRRLSNRIWKERYGRDVVTVCTRCADVVNDWYHCKEYDGL